MANVSLKNVTADFAQNIHVFPPFSLREWTPTAYRYLADNVIETGVSITGTGLGYASNTYPVSGTIKEVRVDYYDDNSAKPEVVVTGLSAAFARLDWRYIPAEHQADFFWAVLLDGNDKIDLGSRATADGFSISFTGDGEYAATFCGDDTIRGDAGDGSIIGDLQRLPEGYVRYGGNDDIRLTQGGNVVGDTYYVAPGATMVSGSDYMSIQAAGEIVGDVRNLYGNTSAGNDTIVGSSGADNLIGDVISVGPNTTLRAGHDSIKAGAGNDSVWGDEQAFVGGGQVYRGGNDRLYGEAGKDTIKAGGGNDTIVGGTAVDRLTGGDGKDQFRFAEKGTIHADVITDFQHLADKLVLESSIFAALGPSVTAAEFLSRSSGSTATDGKHIIYDRSTGKLYYDADDNGAGAAVHFATLSNKPGDLSGSDFLII